MAGDTHLLCTVQCANRIARLPASPTALAAMWALGPSALAVVRERIPSASSILRSLQVIVDRKRKLNPRTQCN